MLPINKEGASARQSTKVVFWPPQFPAHRAPPRISNSTITGIRTIAHNNRVAPSSWAKACAGLAWLASLPLPLLPRREPTTKGLSLYHRLPTYIKNRGADKVPKNLSMVGLWVASFQNKTSRNPLHPTTRNHVSFFGQSNRNKGIVWIALLQLHWLSSSWEYNFRRSSTLLNKTVFG